MRNNSYPRFHIRQRNIYSLLKSPPSGFIQALWPISRSQYQNLIILVSFSTIKPDKEFSFNSTLVFSFTILPCTYKGVDFINKDHTRLSETGVEKESLDELLWFPYPFRHNTTRTDTKEGWVKLWSNRFGDHCFSCTRGPKEKDASWRFSQATEEVRSLLGINNVLEDGLFQVV